MSLKQNEKNIHKGDVVITDHSDSRSNRLIRCYGIVQKITDNGRVIIEMADGSMIKREYEAIAVFVKPPANWKELYRQQQIEFPQPKQPVILRNSSNNRRRN